MFLKYADLNFIRWNWKRQRKENNQFVSKKSQKQKNIIYPIGKGY